MTDASTPQGPLGHHRNLVLGIVVALWLTGTAIALWWFQSRVVQPFVVDQTPPPSSAMIEQDMNRLLQLLPPTADPDAVVLLHFWNPDCLCNQVSQRHFNGLTETFGPQQLRIVVVAPQQTDDPTIAAFTRLNGERMEILRAPADFTPLSSPALALMHSNGKLGYFGAYGFGALCSVASDDFFPNMVRHMLEGAYGPFVNVAGSGCFCRWP